MDHFPRLFNERITGVVVGQSVKESRLFDNFLQLPGLTKVEGGGLIGEHVKTIF